MNVDPEVAALLERVQRRSGPHESAADLHWAALAYQPTAVHWLRRSEVERFLATVRAG